MNSPAPRPLRALATFCVVIAVAAGCAGPRQVTSPPAPARPAVATAPEDVLPEIFRASVQILVERDGAPLRWGSGVIVGARPTGGPSECLVLSAGHTLDRLGPGDTVFALLDRHQADSTKVRAEVMAAQDSPRFDLGLLAIRGGDCRATLAGSAPRLGEGVWVVGFPYGGELTVGRGIVSQVTRGSGGGPVSFMIDASTSHGSSGAGVFDARTGRLIGLVEAFGTARVPIQGIAASPHIDIPVAGMTYVTPVNKIDDFLRASGGAPLLLGRQ